jgi:hypothetical protein
MTPKYSHEQRAILRELLDRLNWRRVRLNKPPVTAAALPPTPTDFRNYYLVDSYNVRRHWRRRPYYWAVAAK